jgi:putative ABC transport system ATP-binding protein
MLFETENVEYTANGRSILGKRSLHIDAGKHLLLLGPSGCGKTTLMNVMAGLLRASHGEVSYGDKNYVSLSDQDLDRLRAENFGFVFQKLHLIGHLTVAQNIALAQTTPDPARIQTLTNDLGLSGKEAQKARDLSVGEAQRVAIARAVSNNPKVIFADEPTSALDDANAAKVMDLIFTQAAKTGATVITATHDARIKDRFETILEMAA